MQQHLSDSGHLQQHLLLLLLLLLQGSCNAIQINGGRRLPWLLCLTMTLMCHFAAVTDSDTSAYALG